MPGLFDTPEDTNVAHAYEVLRNGLRGLHPSSRQTVLLRELASRRGAAHAKSAEDLARQLGTSDRGVRLDVNELRTTFGVQIGASRDAKPGYYLITSQEEAFDTARPFLHQIQKEWQVVRAILNPHQLAELAGQMKIDLAQLDPTANPQEDHHAA